MVHVEITRVAGEYGFEGVDASGHTVRMDTSDESGGSDFGIRPMQMLLMGLGSCSGIDIISILKKQKQPVEGYRAIIDADRPGNVHPSPWSSAKIIFELKGKIDPEKAARACALSIEKYCSVSSTLMLAGCAISWEVKIIN